METKKIKIAIAINELGNWGSCGDSNLSEKTIVCYAKENILDGDGENIMTYFVEVEVPVPVSLTINGKLSND